MATDGKITFDELFDFSDISSLVKLEKAIIGLYDKTYMLIGGLDDAVKSMREGVIKAASELEAKQKTVNITTEKGKEEMLDLASASDKLADAEKKLAKVETEVILTTAKLRQENEILEGQFKDTVKETILLENEIKRLTKTQKELEKDGKNLSQGYVDNKAKLIQLKTELQKLNAENKTAVKEIKAQEGSYDQLNNMLLRLTKQYNSMAQSEKDSVAGQEILGTIKSLDDELKRLDAEMGKFQRNVGNYESGTVSLRAELMKMRNELGAVLLEMRKTEAENKKLSKESQTLEQKLAQVNAELSKIDPNSKSASKRTEELRGQQNELKNKIDKTNTAISENTQKLAENNSRYQQAVESAGRLQDAYTDVQRNIQALASDTALIDGVVNSMQGIVGAFSVAQGAAALFGDENEELQKTFVKLQALMTIMQGLQQVQNMLQKQSAANQLRLRIIQKVNNGLESKNIVIKTASIAVTKMATYIQWLWNNSIKAFPFFWIIGAITAITAAVKLMTAAQRDNINALERIKSLITDWGASLDKLIRKQKEQIEIMKASGANDYAVNEAMIKNATITRQKIFQQIDNLNNARKKASELGAKEQIKIIDEELDALRQRRESQTEIINTGYLQRKILIAEGEREAAQIIANAGKEQIEIEKDNVRKKWKAHIDANVTGARQAMELELQAIDDKNKKETQKTTAKINKDEQAMQKAAQQELKDLNELFELREKAIQEGYEKILRNESLSLEERRDAAYKFEQSQEAIITHAMDTLLMNTELTQTQRAVIIERSYAELSKLYETTEQSITDILRDEFEKQSFARLSENDKQLSSLKEMYLSGQISQLEYVTKSEALQRQSAIYRLEGEVLFKRQMLELAQGEDILQAQRELAEAEKELQDETLNQKLEREKQYQDQRKELQDLGLQTLQEVTAAANELFSISSDKQIAELEKQKNYELLLVGDNAVAKANIEKRYQAQITAEKRKQAKADKANAAFQIALNTAVAITRALADLKFPLSTATAVSYGVLGAAQLAIVLSKPLPAFRKGTKNAPEGPAIVSEAGPELLERNGKFSLTPSVPAIMYLQKGDKIHPAESATTKVYKDAYASLGAASKSNSEQLTAIALQSAFSGAINALPVTVMSWNEAGYQKHTKKRLATAKRISERNKIGGQG